MHSPLKYAGLIRGLIYPVQFDDDPRTGIPRVLDLVVGEHAMDASPMEYLEAIREALASEEALAELIAQDHPENVIRRYLSDVGPRFQCRPARWASRPPVLVASSRPHARFAPRRSARQNAAGVAKSRLCARNDDVMSRTLTAYSSTFYRAYEIAYRPRSASLRLDRLLRLIR